MTIYVPVAASMRGSIASLVKEASGAGKRASEAMSSEFETGGKKAGQAAAAGLASQAKQIERVSAQLASARKGEADAAGAVRVAEVKLQDVRNNAGSSAASLAKAEEDLARARRTQESAQQAVTRQSQQLDAIRSGEATTARSVIRAEEQLQTARNQAATTAGQIRIAETRLTELRDSGRASQAQLATAEESLARARRNHASATDQVRSRELLLRAANDDAATSTRNMNDAVEETGTSMSGMGSKLKEAVSNLKGFALIGGSVGATLMAGIASNMHTEVINDKLAASLGAGPAQAAQYGKVTADVYRGAFGESMEQVSESVGIVASSFQNLQTSGQGSLRGITETALNFASTFGTEVSESVQTVSTLISTGLVTDATQGFDLMTAAFQRVPAAMRDELPEILHEYGVNFAGLGFDAESAFGVLVNAAGKGKFALDKTGDSLKEFSLIAASSVGDSGLEDAYAKVGQNAADMANAIAQGGPAAQKALQGTVDGLLKIPNAGDRAATAIKLFGTPLEDLGPDQITGFLTALQDGRKGMEGFGGSAQRMGQTLNDNGTAKIEAFKRSLQGGFNDAVNGGLTGLMNLTKFVKDNGVAFGIVAGIITAVLMPALITSTVGWTQSGYAAVRSAALSLAASYRTVAGWVMMGASATANAITTSAAWVASGARSAGAFILLRIRAVGSFIATAAGAAANAASTTAAWVVSGTRSAAAWVALKAAALASFVATAAGAVVQAGITAGAWVAGQARMAISIGIATAAFIAQRAVMVAGAIATGVMTAAQWALNSALLANPITWIVILIVGLVAAIVLIATKTTWFQTAWSAAWNGIQAAIGFVWGWLSTSVFPFFTAAIRGIGDAAMWLWNNAIVPAFSGIKTAADFMWQGIQTIFGWIKSGWEAVGNGIRWVVDNVVKPAWEGMKTALGAVRDFFGNVVEGIKTVWDKLKGYVATPINFVINTVWNNGLLKAWNTIAGFLPGLKQMSPLSPVAFAEGGSVPMMSGATRGKDSVHSLLMPDEHVWNVNDVRKSGGQGTQYRMRQMVDAGKPFTWTPGGLAAATSDGGVLPRFADGGAVSAGDKLAPMPGEGGLQDIAKLMGRIIMRLWPKGVSSIGGYRPPDGYNEHSTGRALDVMINDAKTGTNIKDFSLANSKNYPINWTIWQQKMWYPDGRSSGMEDRGSPTQNHMDHDHIFYAEQSVNPNVMPGNVITDGFGGPSTAEMLGIIKKKINEILDKALDPIKKGMAAVIGSPPPEWLGIPPKALDETKTKAVDAAFDLAGKLGDKLRDAYDMAKKVTSSVTNFIKHPFGLFRDQGGYIPAGMSVVRNETGKPEAVLNWKQLEEVRKFLEATGLAAGKGILSDTADFFGFGKIYSTIADLVTPQNQGADVANAGSQQGQGAANPQQSPDATQPPASTSTQPPASTTPQTGGSTYSDPTYGNGSTFEQKDTPLTTKMPDLNHQYDPKGGAEQWRGMIEQALKKQGYPVNPAEVNAWVKQIDTESSGDPNAVQQIVDANGTGESAGVGLGQMIPSTWAAYRDPSLPDNRRDPWAMINAMVRYGHQKYGDGLLGVIGQGHGYDSGGWLPPGLTMAVNKTGRPEAILTAGQWDAIDSMLEALPSAGEFKTVADLAAARGVLPAPVDADASGPAARSGPLVVNENVYAFDADDLVAKQTREVRRASRSEALIGGWS